MTSKERASLRAKANPLEPIFQIGKEGISDNLITQIDDTLDTRELLKVKVHLDTAPSVPREFANELAEKLGAEVIQVIGGVIVLYRKADPDKINAKKQQREKTSEKKTKKKKTKIKGLRQRQKEYEEAHPWAKHNSNRDRRR